MTARWRVERDRRGIWHAHQVPHPADLPSDNCLFTTDWAEAIAHADTEARKAPSEPCS